MTENTNTRYPHFAAWLNATLDRYGTQTSWLARQVGVTHGAVWQWREGRMLPAYERIKPIARALNVKPAAIINAILEDLE